VSARLPSSSLLFLHFQLWFLFLFFSQLNDQFVNQSIFPPFLSLSVSLFFPLLYHRLFLPVESIECWSRNSIVEVVRSCSINWISSFDSIFLIPRSIFSMNSNSRFRFSIESLFTFDDRKTLKLTCSSVHFPLLSLLSSFDPSFSLSPSSFRSCCSCSFFLAFFLLLSPIDSLETLHDGRRKIIIQSRIEWNIRRMTSKRRPSRNSNSIQSSQIGIHHLRWELLLEHWRRRSVNCEFDGLMKKWDNPLLWTSRKEEEEEPNEVHLLLSQSSGTKTFGNSKDQIELIREGKGSSASALPLPLLFGRIGTGLFRASLHHWLEVWRSYWEGWRLEKDDGWRKKSRDGLEKVTRWGGASPLELSSVVEWTSVSGRPTVEGGGGWLGLVGSNRHCQLWDFEDYLIFLRNNETPAHESHERLMAEVSRSTRCLCWSVLQLLHVSSPNLGQLLVGTWNRTGCDGKEPPRGPNPSMTGKVLRNHLSMSPHFSTPFPNHSPVTFLLLGTNSSRFELSSHLISSQLSSSHLSSHPFAFDLNPQLSQTPTVPDLHASQATNFIPTMAIKTINFLEDDIQIKRRKKE